MAIIYTYPQKNKLVDADSVVITDSEDRNMTKQLSIGVIMAPVYALQEQVKIIQKQITEIFETISVIEEQISTINEEIAQLQNCCAENAKAIAANTVNINNNTTAIEDLEVCCEQNNSAISELSEDVKSNESDIEDLEACCDENSGAISELSAQLSAFIKSQTVINQTLQSEIDACCQGGGEPKIINVSPITNIQNGGKKIITVTGEGTNWLTDSPVEIITNLEGEFVISNIVATSDTTLTFTIEIPPGNTSNGGYNLDVVTQSGESAACSGCWPISGEPTPEECPYGKPKSEDQVDPDYDKAVVGENYQVTITTNWFRPDSNADKPLELGNGSTYIMSWEGAVIEPNPVPEVVKIENGKFQQTWTSSSVITEEMQGKPLKVVYRAINCRGESFEEEELITWDVTVVPAPAPGEFKITSTPSTEGKVGEEYAYNIVTSATGKVSFTPLSLPPWATLVNNVITGTPPEGSEGQTFNFAIEAFNGGNTVTQTWTVTVSGSATPEPPEIISTPSTEGKVGERYEYIIQAINCFEISSVSLPPWATLVPGEAPCQATITGTPPEGSAGRKYSFEITITGANGVTTTQSWAVTVSDATVECKPQEKPECLPNDTYKDEWILPEGANQNFTFVNEFYSIKIGCTNPYSEAGTEWRWEPDPAYEPPSWATLTNNGDGTCTISGTPLEPTPFTGPNDGFAIIVECYRTDCPDNTCGRAWTLAVQER